MSLLNRADSGPCKFLFSDVSVQPLWALSRQSIEVIKRSATGKSWAKAAFTVCLKFNAAVPNICMVVKTHYSDARKYIDKKIRLASDQDVVFVLPLIRAYHKFENLKTDESIRESAIKILLSNSEFGCVWLIFCDGKLSGYIVVCRGYSIEFNGFDALVDEFYLVPEIRGLGIGTWVLDVIKQKAKELDINALHLEIARDNSSARALYAKAGFESREKYVLLSFKILD